MYTRLVNWFKKNDYQPLPTEPDLEAGTQELILDVLSKKALPPKEFYSIKITGTDQTLTSKQLDWIINHLKATEETFQKAQKLNKFKRHVKFGIPTSATLTLCIMGIVLGAQKISDMNDGNEKKRDAVNGWLVNQFDDDQYKQVKLSCGYKYGFIDTQSCTNFSNNYLTECKDLVLQYCTANDEIDGEGLAIGKLVGGMVLGVAVLSLAYWWLAKPYQIPTNPQIAIRDQEIQKVLELAGELPATNIEIQNGIFTAEECDLIVAILKTIQQEKAKRLFQEKHQEKRLPQTSEELKEYLIPLPQDAAGLIDYLEEAKESLNELIAWKQTLFHCENPSDPSSEIEKYYAHLKQTHVLNIISEEIKAHAFKPKR